MLNHYVFWEKKNTDLSSWRYYRCPNAPMIAVGGKGGNSESHSGHSAHRCSQEISEKQAFSSAATTLSDVRLLVNRPDLQTHSSTS